MILLLLLAARSSKSTERGKHAQPPCWWQMKQFWYTPRNSFTRILSTDSNLETMSFVSVRCLF